MACPRSREARIWTQATQFLHNCKIPSHQGWACCEVHRSLFFQRNASTLLWSWDNVQFVGHSSSFPRSPQVMHEQGKGEEVKSVYFTPCGCYSKLPVREGLEHPMGLIGPVDSVTSENPTSFIVSKSRGGNPMKCLRPVRDLKNFKLSQLCLTKWLVKATQHTSIILQIALQSKKLNTLKSHCCKYL